MSPKTLLLVDGSSYLYRAFHALPELKNARGEPTGAIYGVLSMLRKLAADYPAQARACVFDARGKTFRDDAYPDYKANRAPMPDELGAQIAPLCEAIAALGWPVLAIEGVEADDVIATLAEAARGAGWRTVISTGDKDLAQLVNPQVTLVNTMSNETLDEAGVVAKFGVPAHRFLDYQALVGDAIDNVPGVPKVGPKTAAKWIQQYGTLESVMAHAGEIGGAVGENLRKSLDWLPKGREILAMRRDVPLPVGLEQLAAHDGDRTKLRELVARFGFKTWLRELEGAGPAEAPASSPESPAVTEASRRRYVTLSDAAGLEALAAKLEAAGLAGFDAAGSSAEPMNARLVGMAFALEESAWYLPLAHDYAGAPDQVGVEPALARLKPWLESPRHGKAGANLKLAAHVLANHGVRLAGMAHDVLLESYVAEVHERHSVEAIARRHLGWKMSGPDEVTGKGAARIGFAAVEVGRATAYAAEIADFALAAHAALYQRIVADPGLKRVYEEIELPTMRVLFEMERHGVLLDAAKLVAQSQELGKQIFALEQQAYELAGGPFNLGSPKQLQEILFERLNLPKGKKTPSGQYSTDEDVLAELALDYPLPKRILEHRAFSKLKSTYTDKLPRSVHPATGRVHTTYSQTTAVTGRLASNEPNLQNIPIRTTEGRKIREAFVAPAGSRIVSADYSQVELRIMAHLSGDAGLRHAFEHGHDVHRATAAEVFGVPLGEVSADQRRTAKVINFGLIYGMSSFGLAQNLGIERATAQAYIESYFARYPGVKRFMDETRAKARSLGYVETVFGRRLHMPEIRSGSPGRRQAAERAAINAPMQGTAADLIKLSMVAVQAWLEKEGLKSKLIMQVHDELVLEVPQAELATVKQTVRELMQGVAKLDVPLVVDVGDGENWDKAH